MAAKRLGMAADPGPEFPGYVSEHFQHLRPRGKKVEVNAPGSLANDLLNED